MTEREFIIKSLKNDRVTLMERAAPSEYLMKVWFNPEVADFLYNDQYTNFSVVKELIDEKIIVFSKMWIHQGQKMVLYVPDFSHKAFKRVIITH